MSPGPRFKSCRSSGGRRGSAPQVHPGKIRRERVTGYAGGEPPEHIESPAGQMQARVFAALRQTKTSQATPERWSSKSKFCVGYADKGSGSRRTAGEAL